MKSSLLLSLTFLTAPLWAADSSVDEVKAAAKKLADAPNYSWTTTTKVPEDSQFKPGPTEGKTEKGGVSWTSSSFGERKMETLIGKEGRTLSKTEDGWKTSEEIRAEREANGGGGGGQGRRGFGGFFRNFKAPAAQAEDLAGKAKELKKDGDSYAGDLTAEALKELLTFGGGRRGGGNGGGGGAPTPPEPTDAKGSVKFWLKDGAICKMELHVEGTIKFGDNERKIDRTSTTEIKDVGSTKLDVSDDVKKKLENAPAPQPPGPPPAREGEKKEEKKETKPGVKEA